MARGILVKAFGLFYNVLLYFIAHCWGSHPGRESEIGEISSLIEPLSPYIV